MEENSNSNSSTQSKNTKIDFEVDAMNYALKNLPSQKQTLFLDQEKVLPDENEKKEKNEITETKNSSVITKKSSPSFNSINSSPKELRASLDKFPVPNPQSTNKKNNLVILLLVFLLLVVLAGGGFYYFKYFFKKKTASINQTNPSPKNFTPENSPLPTTQPVVLPLFADQSDVMTLNTETLLEKILLLKQSAIDNPALKESLKKGIFYQVKKEEKILSAQELIQALDIALPLEAADLIKEGWLFVYLDQRSILKTALVLTVDENNYNNQVFLEIEKDFPLLFKNLFIEEDSSVQESEITFLTNKEDTRLRYFNFTKDDPTRTIDWAKIDKYLFFTTSKEAAFQLISLLEK